MCTRKALTQRELEAALEEALDELENDTGNNFRYLFGKIRVFYGLNNYLQMLLTLFTYHQ